MDELWIEYLRDLEQVRTVAPRLSSVEVRADDDGAGEGPGTLTGHFSVFNSWYEIDSWFEGNFLERIAPGSFKRTFNAFWDSGDPHRIQVLLEHGFDPTVGDKPLGVPSALREDEKGAFYEAELFDAGYVRELVPALRSGVYGASFRFRVMHDEWVKEPEPSEHNPGGIPERTIKEVRTMEFGPTVFPASPTATAGMRSQTDEFYERLRSREPKTYDQLLARAREIRTPDAPKVDTAAAAPVDVRADGPAAPAEDPPAPGHSEVITVHTTNDRSTIVDPMTIEERAARQSEITARLQELDAEFAGSVMSEEARSEWDSLNEELEQHRAAIEETESRRAKLAEIASRSGAREEGSVTPANTPQARSTRTADNIYDLTEIRQRARSVDDLPELYRDHAMRAVENGRYGARDVSREDAQERVRHLLDTVDDDEGTLARRILVTGSPVYQRAFGKATTALSTQGLTAEEQRALSLGSEAGGGYAVPFDLDPSVILTSDGSVNPLRQISRVEQIVGKEWQGITSAGITVTRKAEAAQTTDDSPSFAQPTVRPTRVDGFVPFSIELDQDWNSMRSEITRLLNDAKDQEEAESFLNGDGEDEEPGGLIETLATASNVDVSGGGLTAEDIYSLEDALGDRFLARARFLANGAVYNAARQLDSAGGADLWVRLGAGLPGELIGYPAHKATHMPSTMGTGDRYLVLGDFEHFLIVDRVGMNVELVPHLFGANQRPTGQRGLLAIWRNSSLVLVDNAFRVLNGTA